MAASLSATTVEKMKTVKAGTAMNDAEVNKELDAATHALA